MSNLQQELREAKIAIRRVEEKFERIQEKADKAERNFLHYSPATSQGLERARWDKELAANRQETARCYQELHDLREILCLLYTRENLLLSQTGHQPSKLSRVSFGLMMSPDSMDIPNQEDTIKHNRKRHKPARELLSSNNLPTPETLMQNYAALDEKHRLWIDTQDPREYRDPEIA